MCREMDQETSLLGTSLVVQWLKPWASTAGDMGSIPGQGTKILYTGQCGQKKEKEKKKPVSYLAFFYVDSSYKKRCMFVVRFSKVKYNIFNG